MGSVGLSPSFFFFFPTKRTESPSFSVSINALHLCSVSFSHHCAA